MTIYKRETPYDWFTSYVNSRADDAQALRSLLLNIVAQKLDADDIQDIFQPDMEADEFDASPEARAEIEATRARLAGLICTDLAAASYALREEGVSVMREGGWNV